MKESQAASSGRQKSSHKSQRKLENTQSIPQTKPLEPLNDRYLSLNPSQTMVIEAETTALQKFRTLEGSKHQKNISSPPIKDSKAVKSSRSYLQENTDHSLVNLKKRKSSQSKHMHERIKTQKGKIVHITVNESLGNKSDLNSTLNASKRGNRTKFLSEVSKVNKENEGLLEREVREPIMQNRPFSPAEKEAGVLEVSLIKSMEMKRKRIASDQRQVAEAQDNIRYLELGSNKIARKKSKESKKIKKRNIQQKLKDQINCNTGTLVNIQTFSSASSGGGDQSKQNHSGSNLNPLLQNESSHYLGQLGTTFKGMDRESSQLMNRFSDQLMASPLVQSRYHSNDQYQRHNDIPPINEHLPFYNEKKAFVDSNYTFRPNSNLMIDPLALQASDKIIIEDQLQEEEDEKGELPLHPQVEFNISQGHDFLKSAHFTQHPQTESNHESNGKGFNQTEKFRTGDFEGFEGSNERRRTEGSLLKRGSAKKEQERLRRSSPGKFTFNQEFHHTGIQSHKESNKNYNFNGSSDHSQTKQQDQVKVNKGSNPPLGRSSQSSITHIDPHQYKFNSKASKTDFGFYAHHSPPPYDMTSRFMNHFDFGGYTNPYFNSSGGYSIRDGSRDYMSGSSGRDERSRSRRRQERRERRREKNIKHKLQLKERDNIISILQDSVSRMQEDLKHARSLPQSDGDSRTQHSYMTRDFKSYTSSNIGNGVSAKDDKSLKLKDLEHTLKEQSQDKEEFLRIVLENNELKKVCEQLQLQLQQSRKEGDECRAKLYEVQAYCGDYYKQLGEMKKINEKLVQERNQSIKNSQEFRRRNQEMEENVKMMTLQSEKQIKKMYKLKQKNQILQKEFSFQLQEKEQKINFLSEEIKKYAEVVQKQKKHDEKILQDHYQTLKQENIALKNQIKKLQQNQGETKGNLTCLEADDEMSQLQQTSMANMLKRSRSPQYTKVAAFEDLQNVMRSVCKELHLENTLDVLKRIKDMKDQIKRQRKEKKLIFNLQQMAKDYPLEKEPKKTKAAPTIAKKVPEVIMTNNNTIEDITSIQGLELPTLKEVWKWLKQLLQAYLMVKGGNEYDQPLETIRTVLGMSKGEDVIQFLKAYKYKHEQEEISLEIMKKLLGLPQMSTCKDIEYQIQVRLPGMRIQETRKSGSLVDKRK